MKKFFAFLMAAAVMMTGCNDPKPTPGPGNDPDNKPGTEEFYGMTLDNAEVINRGDYYNNGTNSYIINMYKMDGDAASRIFTGEIITPEVNDGVIPEGKYTIEDGTMEEGVYDDTFMGSYFIRNTEDGYIMLVTGGYFEVKHVENGYQLTASFSGIDAFSQETVLPAEGRFTGAPTMQGLAANNNFEIFTPIVAQAAYFPMGDGTAVYDILLGDQGAVDGVTFPAHMVELAIVAEDLGAETLPQGTFVVDPFGTGAVNTQIFNDYFCFTADGQEIEDTGLNGKVTIKALGEGKYSIEAISFGALNGYKQKYSGPVYLSDGSIQGVEFDAAQANFQGEYEGNTWWVLFLIDQAGDSIYQMYVNTPADNTAAAGIPSGTYAIADTMEPFTIDAGYVDDEGYANGSLIVNLEQTSVKDLITSGEVNITNNGDGTYAIDLAVGTYLGENLAGSFTGKVNIVDDSEGGSQGGGNEGGGNESDAFATNIETVEMYFLGLGEWVVYLNDLSFNGGTGVSFMLDTYQAEDATFAQGLATGTYTFADTYEACTIWPGGVDADGYLEGSLALTGNQQQAYDYLDKGSMNVTNNGDGTYAFEFLFEGSRYAFAGSYNGAVTAVDATQEGVAPAKAPAKKASMFKSNCKNTNSNLRLNTMMSSRFSVK